MWLGPGGLAIIAIVIGAAFLAIVALVLEEVYVRKCLKCRRRLFRRRESGYCAECEEIVKRGRDTRYYPGA